VQVRTVSLTHTHAHTYTLSLSLSGSRINAKGQSSRALERSSRSADIKERPGSAISALTWARKGLTDATTRGRMIGGRRGWQIGRAKSRRACHRRDAPIRADSRHVIPRKDSGLPAPRGAPKPSPLSSYLISGSKTPVGSLLRIPSTASIKHPPIFLVRARPFRSGVSVIARNYGHLRSATMLSRHHVRPFGTRGTRGTCGTR